MAPTIWYVDGDNGSDGNSGLTLALAKKTITGLVGVATSGTASARNKIYVKGTVRQAASARFAGLSYLDIEPLPGELVMPWVRADTDIAASGWSNHGLSGSKKTIGAGLTELVSCLLDYAKSTDANGIRRADLKPVASANAVDDGAGGGANHSFFYDSAGGILYVRSSAIGVDATASTAALNGGTKTLSYVRSNQHDGNGRYTAITIEGTSAGSPSRGIDVKGIWFSNFSASTRATEEPAFCGTTTRDSYAVMYMKAEDCQIADCIGEGSGFHTFGFTNDANKNNKILRCQSRGMRSRSDGCNAIVMHATAGNVVNALVQDCVVHATLVLNPAGADFGWTSGGVALNSGCYYGHANPATSSYIDSLVWERCTIYQYGLNCEPAFEATDHLAGHASDPWNYKTYRAYAVDCRIYKAQKIRLGDSVAFARTRMVFDSPAGAAQGNTFSIIAFGATKHFLFDACDIVYLNRYTNENGPFQLTNNMQVRLLNTSILLDTTPGGARRLVNFNGATTAKMLARNSIFVFTGIPAFNRLCTGDGAHTWVAGDFGSCVYWNVGLGGDPRLYSDQAALDNQVEWVSPLMDAAGLVLSANPFVQPIGPTLDLDRSSTAYTTQTVASPTTTQGINNRLPDQRRGSWQYGGVASSLGGGAARMSIGVA